MVDFQKQVARWNSKPITLTRKDTTSGVAWTCRDDVPRDENDAFWATVQNPAPARSTYTFDTSQETGRLCERYIETILVSDMVFSRTTRRPHPHRRTRDER